MNDHESDAVVRSLHARVSQLERKQRTLACAALSAVVVLSASVLVGLAQRTHPTTQVLRARGLIIEDADGKPRMMFGSPIADRNHQGNPRTGMIINDGDGAERFGLGLYEKTGRVVMGFDAPRGKGDDRNRERITIVADGEGGAHIRFLDRQTRVPARLYLADDNRVWLEFLEFSADKIFSRRMGAAGIETSQRPGNQPQGNE